MTEKASWTNNLGHSVVAKQEFYMGTGDDKPYWYCCECGCRKSEIEPVKNTICKAVLSRFSNEKFHSALTTAFSFYTNNAIKTQIEQEIQQHDWNFGAAFSTLRANLSPEWLDKLDEFEEYCWSESGRRQDYWRLTLDSILQDLLISAHNGDESFLNIEYECTSTTFKYEQHHGNCIGVQYGEWLDIWHELNK